MKIMIIDDEKFLINNLSRYLSKSISSEIKCVDSADEALDLVHREKFDLIICDLNISDQVDGTLLRKIYKKVPSQKFIVISAQEIPDLRNYESTKTYYKGGDTEKLKYFN